MEVARLALDYGWSLEDRAEPRDGVWYVAGSSGSVDYPEQGHQDLSEFEDRSFWFRHRNRVLGDALDRIGSPSALWEIGAGNGYVARGLTQRGVEVVTVEPGRTGALTSARRGIQVSICGTLQDLHLPDECIPAVGCFDVLEHIAEPHSLLLEVFRTLEPGGLFAVTVPSLPWLWSDHDEIAGHHRRYTLSSLHEELERVGLERVLASYFMAPLLPAVTMMRVLPYRFGSRRRAEETWERTLQEVGRGDGHLHRLVDVALHGERRWLQRAALPLGTSIYAIYAKPETQRPPADLAAP